MKIVKFGGRSLANGNGISKVLDIIENKVNNKEKFITVLSARGSTTDDLENILEKASKGEDYLKDWESFVNYQLEPDNSVDLKKEFDLLQKVFEGVKLVEDYSDKIKDLVLAQGELLSVKTVSHLLKQKDINTEVVDSRNIFVTDDRFGGAQVIEKASEQNAKDIIGNKSDNNLIVTGFIASNDKGETTTLGRNGSNYSASLLAKYLHADELENYTHVNGIYTANPDLVEDAKIIDHLNYQETNELANFGTSILHAKTVIPLIEKNIPLRILNTFNPDSKGTLVSKEVTQKGVKSISVQNDVAVINLEGRGLLGKTGVDARIFNALQQENISIGLVSQGSSERGVGLVVPKESAEIAINALKNEFKLEIKQNDIDTIKAIDDVSVITVVGQDLSGFSSAYQSLVKNDIKILLVNNTISGNNISLVVNKKDQVKAVNLIHFQIFGVNKKVNLAVFGKGTVGGALIDQIRISRDKVGKRKETDLNIFAIIGSKKILFLKDGIVPENWRDLYEEQGVEHTGLSQVVDFARENHLENLIALDNTADKSFVNNYIPLIKSGFDLISSNKIANTESFSFYKELRNALKENRKKYLYETNVGAGLPLIDTIKLLHDSGENITRIRGVFSGSLSYLFNTFSEEDKDFSSILSVAISSGYTEPDPREDLCGNDVARKLLILARELDLENEFEEIEIENLIPENLREGSAEDFLGRLEELNPYYKEVKDKQEEGHVLRYVGDLSGDLKQTKGDLKVSLVSVPNSSALGQIKGADSLFEIYTESYGENPIVIQGAGAGAAVTARGVFGDILRLAETL